MKFFTFEGIYKEAQENGYTFEYEKEHTEVIYEYLREFCLNELIRTYNTIPANVNVLLPDPDNVSVLLHKTKFDTIQILLYMGKPEVISAYSISGKKMDNSIVRNISLTGYWGAIKEMFEEYKITAQYDTYDPKGSPAYSVVEI